MEYVEIKRSAPVEPYMLAFARKEDLNRKALVSLRRSLLPEEYHQIQAFQLTRRGRNRLAPSQVTNTSPIDTRRELVNNPEGYIPVSGFENWLIDLSRHDIIEFILKQSQNILNSLAREWKGRGGAEPTIKLVFGQATPNMFLQRCLDVDSALGSMTTALRTYAETSGLKNNILTFRKDTYRLVQDCKYSSIVTHTDGGKVTGLSETYQLPSSPFTDNELEDVYPVWNNEPKLLTLGELTPNEREAWLFAANLGRHGHVVVRNLQMLARNYCFPPIGSSGFSQYEANPY